MNTARRIAKNISVLLLARIVSMVTSFFLMVAIARYLGDADFGKYSFAFAYSSILVILSDLGLKTLIVREVARNREFASKYFLNVSLVKFILSIITFSLICTGIKILRYPYDTTVAVYVIGLTMLFYSFNTFFASIFQAFEKMEFEAGVGVLERIIAAALVLFAIFSGYGLIGITLMFLLGSTLKLLLALYIVRRRFARLKAEIDLAFCMNTLKRALPFGLAGVFGMVYYWVDSVMLSIMKGDAVVGWYNASYRLLEPLVFVPGIIATSLFPVFSKLFHSSSTDSLKIYCRKGIQYLLSIGLPIAVGTTFLANRFILLMYGKEYANSVIALKIIIWAVPCTYSAAILGILLNAIDKEKLSLLNSGIAMLLNIALNLLLIPRMSYIGASVATVVTELFLLISLFCWIGKYLYVLPFHRIALKPTIASAVMGISLIYVKEQHLLLSVPLSAAIYFSILYAIRSFSQEDKVILGKLIHG
jgi:O-antigen/teichoic acid export membrane protein